MKCFIACYLSAMLVAACSNNTADSGLLQTSPYKGLTDSLARSPGDAALYYKRGVLLYQHNEETYAQKDLQKAWELNPTEEHGLSLATVLSRKSPDTALYFLTTALQRLPQSTALALGVAHSWEAKGDSVRALAVTDSLLVRQPSSIDALLLKSRLLKALGQPAAALQCLEKAYTLAPFDPELVHNLAFEYAQAGNPRALALADSLIAADINAIHAEPYYFKGLYYEAKGAPAEAVKQLNAAIQHDYYFLDAHMEKGQLYFEQQNYAEAQRSFTLATTITPTFADAYYWLGKTKEARGIKAEAKLDYQRAYGLDKGLTEAKAAADRL